MGETRKHFSHWSPWFGLFVCPCYNRRTHFPKLKDPGAQNITACENQGKQCKLSDHWKFKKSTLFFFFKITGWHKKDKKIEIQVLKTFTKKLFKKTEKVKNMKYKGTESLIILKYSFDHLILSQWTLYNTTMAVYSALNFLNKPT